MKKVHAEYDKLNDILAEGSLDGYGEKLLIFIYDTVLFFPPRSEIFGRYHSSHHLAQFRFWKKAEPAMRTSTMVCKTKLLS